MRRNRQAGGVGRRERVTLVHAWYELAVRCDLIRVAIMAHISMTRCRLLHAEQRSMSWQTRAHARFRRLVTKSLDADPITAMMMHANSSESGDGGWNCGSRHRFGEAAG